MFILDSSGGLGTKVDVVFPDFGRVDEVPAKLVVFGASLHDR